MATDEYIELRFRRVNEWIGPRPYVCGWPNFERADYQDGRGIVYGHYLLPEAAAAWRDVPATEFGDLTGQPLRARFSRANSYAVAQGYQHGFPNFEQADYGAGLVFGTYLIAPGTAEFRDVPALDLGLSADPAADSMDTWFWRAGRYASSQGFAAGMPSGHVAHYGAGAVCGILLYPAGSVQWVDIPGTELGIESGLPPGGPPARPVPFTVSAFVTRSASSSVVTTPALAAFPDATITGVRNRFGRDLTVTHYPRHAGRPGAGVTHSIPAAPPGGTGPLVSDFNGRQLEGDWIVFVPSPGSLTGDVEVSFDVYWTP
ncbi:hypothetical protein [Cryptosporangium sp. NPDC051539]|uniref:hypothetical protein n=1 Tax=Cryptosporangium sp. NPDC051539 TaxID=3363962 RepID=UPI003799BFAE